MYSLCFYTIFFTRVKPTAALVRLAPAACLYVGDAERDVESAVAAGMRALIANYGYLDESDRPETWGAHGRIDAPLEVLSYL